MLDGVVAGLSAAGHGGLSPATERGATHVMSDEKSTYHQHAMTDAELSGGGRWGGTQRPRVNGAEPIVTTPAVAPQWLQDMAALPDEEPLGMCVDDIALALGGEGGCG